MNPTTLRLYVWPNAMSPRGTGVIGFAIAANMEQAKAIIRNSACMEIQHWGKCSVHPTSEAIAYTLTEGAVPNI